jgi:hypothetical protein
MAYTGLMANNEVTDMTTTLTVQQAKALRAIAVVIQEAIEVAGPMGAPGGHLYAAMMTGGCSLHQFQQIMGGLERAGFVSKDGDCYRNVKRFAA